MLEAAHKKPSHSHLALLNKNNILTKICHAQEHAEGEQDDLCPLVSLPGLEAVGEDLGHVGPVEEALRGILL